MAQQQHSLGSKGIRARRETVRLTLNYQTG